MKLLRYVPVKAAVLFCLAAAGCKDGETVETEYIILSADSYTFDASGLSGFTVEVRSNIPWEAKSDDGWITVTGRDETSVSVSAAPNEGTGMRSGQVEFSGGGITRVLKVDQLPEPYGGIFREFGDFYGNGVKMSKGGKRIAGLRAERLPDETLLFTPVIVETATGNITELEPMEKVNGITGVSDDGRTLLVECSDNTLLVRYGEVREIESNGFTFLTVEDMSADGSVWVGWGRNPQTKKYQGIKWTDGRFEALENPENNALGEPLRQGAMARGCSADGSVIYGAEWDTKAALYWKDGRVEFAGKGITNIHVVDIGGVDYALLDRPVMYRNNNKISPNGRYISTVFLRETYREGDRRPTETYCPCFIDLESGEGKVFDEYQDYGAMGACDDGTIMFGFPYQGNMEGFFYHPGTGSLVSSTEWFYDRYGIIVPNNRIVDRISSDERVIFGRRPIVSAAGLSYRYWYCMPSAEEPPRE